MVDMVFDLKGGFVSEGYAFTLWDEVANILPWIDDEEFAGLLPLRGSASGEVLLLSLRSKLVLRLPTELAAQAGALSGHELNVGSGTLRVGAVTERALQPYTTLHAHLVEGEEDEEMFLAGVAARLQEMGIACKWICGKYHTVRGAGQAMSGFSLVLHDLKPEDSLQVQRAGLGGSRRFGCGIFVPYKAISGLG